MNSIAPWDLQGQQSIPWWNQQDPLAAQPTFAQSMSQYAQGNPAQTAGQIDIAAPALSGWQKAGIGIQAGSSLLNGILGMKQYGLAKDSLNFQKDAFNKNYNNQVKTTNNSIENRYRAALGANPTLTESLDEYMQRNRVG